MKYTFPKEEYAMSNNDKKKSLAKDIAAVASIWGPLLFIIIGGLVWKNGGFDGTIMEQLFPALFFGFIAAFGVIIVLSNIFKNSSTIWWVVGAITLVATVICYMLELTSILTVGGIVLAVGICLLVLIKWIAGQQSKYR